jgi:hypothetical protein
VSKDDRRLKEDVVAFHEAGHAVACAVLKLTLHKTVAASIVRKTSYNRTRYGQVLHHVDHGGRNASIITLCGPVAEDLYIGSTDIWPESDVESFCMYSAQMLRGCTMMTAGKHPRFVELFAAELVVAKILMLEHWEAVRLIAAALLEKRKLTRKEVLDLYTSTLKPEQASMPLDWAPHEKAVEQHHHEEWKKWHAAKFGKKTQRSRHDVQQGKKKSMGKEDARSPAAND